MFGRSMLGWVAVSLLAAGASARDAGELRLVPFPKSVTLGEGAFQLGTPVVLRREGEVPPLAVRRLADECGRAGLAWSAAADDDPHAPQVCLKIAADAPALGETPWANEQSYRLSVAPDRVEVAGRSAAGLLYGVETLCQLIRANRQATSIPCLEIADWPSLRWRCFQDDLTRGPSSTPATLRHAVDLGAHLKMNLFTYYMEYQYAFRKHPQIGPADGSLTPAELADLVEFARQFQVDILGNQQSFGHFEHILRHEEFAALREGPGLLTPVREETYSLLDDLYSEVCPLLPFEMFNVCCDETWGLGSGPSKELAQQIGVGGVYVRHVRRVHDLLREKYGKRMMMWGDIILQHPDHLAQVPRDTVMLTWGYGAKESFDDQIAPFAQSGYEFFVCPGISNWSRILPDFAVATANIRNFVRDGAARGAVGMLNTAWEDDGESLQGYKWHGYAWGAECAWNASTTTPEDFNRRVGAVLFGERGDRFGQAIALLGQCHALPGMLGMNNRRYWQDDFAPCNDPPAARASAERLLALVRPAIEHLEACRAEATVNASLLDAFLLGARRMEHIGLRTLDGLEIARRNTPASTPEDRAAVRAIVERTRERHLALGREFQRIWLSECKPYALDRVLARYAFE